MSWLLIGALTAVSVVPPLQELKAHQGMCATTVKVVVTPHKDNRFVEIMISDGGPKPTVERWTLDPNRWVTHEKYFSMLPNNFWRVTAWVIGPNESTRGGAVGVVTCS